MLQALVSPLWYSVLTMCDWNRNRKNLQILWKIVHNSRLQHCLYPEQNSLFGIAVELTWFNPDSILWSRRTRDAIRWSETYVPLIHNRFPMNVPSIYPCTLHPDGILDVYFVLCGYVPLLWTLRNPPRQQCMGNPTSATGSETNGNFHCGHTTMRYWNPLQFQWYFQSVH